MTDTTARGAGPAERAKRTQRETVMSRLDTVIERGVAPSAGTVDMKLEVVVIPVSDVKRAKRFYSNQDGEPFSSASRWRS